MGYMNAFATVYGWFAGLGRLRVFNDELLMQVLSLLPAEALARLACVNRALYCFANHEDLWRALTLEVSFITTIHVCTHDAAMSLPCTHQLCCSYAVSVVCSHQVTGLVDSNLHVWFTVLTNKRALL